MSDKFIGLEIRGAEELERALRALGREASEEIRLAALLIAAEPLRRRMGQTLRRSSGAGPHAADAIEVAKVREVDGDRLGPGETAVAVGPRREFFYAYFLEFGTRRMSAKGDLRRAYDETCRDLAEIWAEEAWRLIRAETRTYAPTAGGARTV